MSPSEIALSRLIVAADFDPSKFGGIRGVQQKFRELISLLSGTGATIKLNSLLRYMGQVAIKMLRDEGLKCFADYKLDDVDHTILLDAMMLKESGYIPAMLTVMCASGVTAMQKAQETLPETKVLGVTVLTSHDEASCFRVFGCTPNQAVINLAKLAYEAGLHGLVCSGKDVQTIRSESDLSSLKLVTPGIRPKWYVTPDEQKRVVTPTEAITSGADYIVIGRPIILAENPKEALHRTVEEIHEALNT